MYYLKHLTVAAIAFAIFMGFIAFPVVITNDPRMDIPMAAAAFASCIVALVIYVVFMIVDCSGLYFSNKEGK